MGTTRQRFTRMWADLAPIGRDHTTGGYRRFAWTAVDTTLREWFGAEAAARGLDLTEDRAGNQWAWWGDPDEALARGVPSVVTGSHLDSVPDGGAFDGPLGVVSAFVALDSLRDAGVRPTRPVAVVNLVDEEGARFGVACAGSRVLSGALPAARALALTDADGLTLAEALQAAGRDPRSYGPDREAMARIGTFVELHIEQGRWLADADRAVALGREIIPHGRWRVEVPGEANHAGTTALADRRDALLVAAQVVLRARSAAQERGCVATVGRLDITPGGVNAIAGHVTAWLDARGADEDAVRAVVAAVRETARAGQGEVAEVSWTEATPFDATLTQRLAALLHDAPVIPVGAGHDAGILATAGVPTAMVFVRNPTGVSHSPAEHAEEADCLAGVEALAAVLTDLVTDPVDERAPA